MASLLALALAHAPRVLEANQVLVTQGGEGGNLYILEDGELAVERDGVRVTTISATNALIGEMSVLLGTPSSATVRSTRRSTVLVIPDARAQLLKDPDLMFRLGAFVASRLDTTTALLVQLSKEHNGSAEQSLLSRLLSAIQGAGETVARHDLFDGPPGPFSELPRDD
jgi:CRP-like cAMP-binding protein